ncbi:MAG TPA: hypothetical protein VGR34_05925 [Candidatus Dormibacteraeota bacterium]|nr:hypothetical protein [Candidatus Dormibacteraeota bacterium]
MTSPPTSTDPESSVERRGLWAFWAATALAVLGVTAPYLLGGGSSRLTASVIPFGVAAIAFGACSLVYDRGRPIATALYFVASLAVVYGILSALAVPLRIAMLGACPADSGPCLPGLERPITTEESTALGFVIGIGIVAVLAGFFGLRTLYHRSRRHEAIPPATPPVRRIAPVATKAPVETAPAPAAKAAVVTEAPAEPEPQAELPAHEPDPELPAHTSEVTPEPGLAGSMPAPQSQLRRSKPKAPPEPPTSTNTE